MSRENVRSREVPHTHTACTQLIRNPFCSSPSALSMFDKILSNNAFSFFFLFLFLVLYVLLQNNKSRVFFTLRHKYTRTTMMRDSVNFCVKFHVLFTQEDLAGGNAPQHVLLVLDSVRFRPCVEPGLFGRLTAVSVLDKDCVAGTSPIYTRSLFRRPSEENGRRVGSSAL